MVDIYKVGDVDPGFTPETPPALEPATVTALVGDVDPGFTPETPPALGPATVTALAGDVDPGRTPETSPALEPAQLGARDAGQVHGPTGGRQLNVERPPLVAGERSA
jgi:hypothetical protein